MLVKCQQCHIEVDIFPSRAKTFRYCSLECRKAANTLSKPCGFCREMMTGYSSKISAHRFCSIECRAKWQSQHPEIFTSSVATTRVTKVCPTCKNSFQSWRAARKKYCSVTCWQAHRSIAMRGAGHPRFVGENSNGDRATFSKFVKGLIDDRCALCDWQLTPNDVCHIIPCARGGENTLDNVVILCPNHHRAFDTGLIALSSLEGKDARSLLGQT